MDGVDVSDAPYRAFSDSSYWNLPLPAEAPIDPNSDAYIRDSKPNNVDKQGNPVSYLKLTVNTKYAQPIYFSSDSDPLYTIMPAQYGPAVTLRIPAEAAPAPGSDAQLTIIDRTTNQAVGLWKASFDADWHARGTDRYYLDSDGLAESVGGKAGNDGHRGVPSPVRAVRLDEVQHGAIRHRLECFWHATYPAHVFPMDGYEHRKGKVPEGMVMRIKPSVDLDRLGLAPQALVIARAIQRYGCIVGDNSGSTNRLKVQANVRWDIDEDALSPISWDDYEFVQAGYFPTNIDFN